MSDKLRESSTHELLYGYVAAEKRLGAALATVREESDRQRGLRAELLYRAEKAGRFTLEANEHVFHAEPDEDGNWRLIVAKVGYAGDVDEALRATEAAADAEGEYYDRLETVMAPLDPGYSPIRAGGAA